MNGKKVPFRGTKAEFERIFRVLFLIQGGIVSVSIPGQLMSEQLILLTPHAKKNSC